MPRRIVGLLLPVFLFLSFIPPVKQQKADPSRSSDSLSYENFWVDSVFNSLNNDQRIGQLFMVAAFSNKTQKHVDEIEELIKESNIGGLIFFQGGPARQARLTNQYQKISKVPLLIAMDAEWGLGMRLDKDSVMSFPKQMTLGAIQDNELIYKMGLEVARQCRRLGVHINFAPVLDVNSNPDNPVIGMRSFGEDKEDVALKGIAYAKGLQQNKVMACAKHFPGHGDTGSDSHLTLPVITHSKERMSEVDLYPFRKAIADSIMSIMVAHIHVPAYDSTPNRATTLSKTVVTDLLKKEMNFQGLVFTDALNMKGVSSFYKPGEVDALALLAGNDVLLYAENVPVAIKKINKAIQDQLITKEEVEARVKKILHAKFWAGLGRYEPVKLENLYQDLNTGAARSIQLLLYAKAMTLLNNKNNLIPISILDTTSIACLSIGLEKGNPFQQSVSNYASVNHFAVPKNPGQSQMDSLLSVLAKYEVVLIGLHGTNAFNSKDYGITENAKALIDGLQRRTTTVLSMFGNPYALKYFTGSRNIICAYEDNDMTQRLVPQLIFGGTAAEGKLPVTADPIFPDGCGIVTTTSVHRLSYAFPENASMDSQTLLYIDSIAIKAIADQATPGCQVLVAKDGMVVFSKSYGHLTYDKTQEVQSNTIYDIASISKVAGTLQAVMFLEERGLIDIDKKASYYLPELKKTNKDDIKVRDVLTHQAGLIPFIPHWKKTLDSLGFMKTYYCDFRNDTFCREVIPGLYSLASIEDSIWKWSIDSDLLKKPKKQKTYDYVYSDIGFYIMKRIVEGIINQPLEDFMQQNFYDPLGLTTMMYRPLSKFPSSQIAPTEEDKYFRKTLIRGTVHDQGAALLGGVAGHAGLFSNANDLAVLMQMNLDKGYYGGLRYLLPGTVPEFALQQFPKTKNRRGLGWDKPEPAGNGPTSNYASSNTFGHTGFTGTAVWVDPDHNLVYVFLSNRIYPDTNNNKLIKNGIRTRIQDIIYKSIINYH